MVDVLQITGNPRSWLEEAFVAELLALAKVDVLKIWAARAQCLEGVSSLTDK